MLREEQKQQMLCPLSSSKSSLVRTSTFISQKIIDWHQNKNATNWEYCWEKRKMCKMCGHCLRAKAGFWALRPSFWEKNWLARLNNESEGPEDCEEKTETGNSVTTAFQQKFTFQLFGFISKWIFGWDRQNQTIDLKKFLFSLNDSKSVCGSRRNFNAFFRVLKEVKIVSAFSLR